MDSFIQTHEAALRLGPFLASSPPWPSGSGAPCGGHLGMTIGIADHRDPREVAALPGPAGNELAERTLVANQVLVF